MTPTPEIETRIAEALGWRWQSKGGVCVFRPSMPLWDKCEAPSGPFEPRDYGVPAYCSDLNAIATARKRLTEAEREQFLYELDCILRPTGSIIGAERWAFVDAPAEIQARALLSVLERRKP